MVSVEKHFFQAEQNAFWSFVVAYLETDQGTIGEQKRSSVDYKEVLSLEDFRIYSQLRELRNSLAKEEGKPAYAIFTNEQLARLVTDRVTGKSAMAAIAGIGESRLEQYATKFLPLLQELFVEDRR